MDPRTLVGSIAIAAAGLAACSTGGPVEPPPPPPLFQCPDGSNALTGTGSMFGSTVLLSVIYNGFEPFAWSATPDVSGVTGGTLTLVAVSRSNARELDLAIALSALPASGSFDVAGKLEALGMPCSVSQTLSFSVGDAGAVVVTPQRP
jgi:hypothetical protein